jgi:hypothetical protein
MSAKSDFEPKVLISSKYNLSCAKTAESTRRKQAIYYKGSLFYSHCDYFVDRPNIIGELLDLY